MIETCCHSLITHICTDFFFYPSKTSGLISSVCHPHSESLPFQRLFHRPSLHHHPTTPTSDACTGLGEPWQSVSKSSTAVTPTSSSYPQALSKLRTLCPDCWACHNKYNREEEEEQEEEEEEKKEGAEVINFS